jgi:hypothetical protein
VTESEPGSVKKVSPRGQRYDLPSSAATVGVVANYWMADRRQVDPDLMRAPGVQVST